MDPKCSSWLTTLIKALFIVVLTTIGIYFFAQRQSFRLDDAFFMVGAFYVFISCIGLFGDSQACLDFRYLHAKSITSTQEDCTKENCKNLTDVNVPLILSGVTLIILGFYF